MKKINIISGIAIISIFLLSCSGNGNGASTTEAVATHQHDTIHADMPELNNGERWVVNEEMKPFIQAGSELVNTYIKTSDTGFQQLSEQLKAQNDQLIANCTMSGQSHDELHKWLHPHLNLVKQLSEAATPEAALPVVSALQQSYQDFGKYFQ